MTAPVGVLVMAYGGPDSLDDVEPYLQDVRGGRPTAPEVVAEVRERYRRIGGRSPINERTAAQARGIERALNARGGAPYRCVVGMKHWTPRIADALERLASGGIRRAVGVVMAPHYSRMSVGGYFQRVADAGSPVEVAKIERWHLLPAYLDAVVRRVRETLARFPAERRDQVPVVFSAHSLPERIREWNDPYCGELEATVAALAERLGGHPHEFAFQSAGRSAETWLGPDVGEVMTRLRNAGSPGVVIAPIGFTSDHVEILYDIDVEYERLASSLSFPMARTAMLNDDPEVMGALAGLVRRVAIDRGWDG